MSLDENVELETEVAGDFWLNYPIYSLHKFEKTNVTKFEKVKACTYLWKWRFVFENWDLQKIESTPYLKGFYFKANQNLDINFTRKLKTSSVLSPKQLDEEKEIKRILTYLKTVFYPYQHGRIDANLKNLALENNGKYVICLKWKKNYYFKWNLWNNWFYLDEQGTNYQEIYNLQDIVDFLDWKIELYSNFWSYLEPGTNIYLWECLGANFINNEIVFKKFKYHFDLAKTGKTPADIVREIIKSL